MKIRNHIIYFSFSKSKFQKYMELHDKRVYHSGITYLIDEQKRAEVIEADNKRGMRITYIVPPGHTELSPEQEYYNKLVADFEAL